MEFDPKWLTDPQVFQVNRLPAHASYMVRGADGAPLEQTLDGAWKFFYAQTPGASPQDMTFPAGTKSRCRAISSFRAAGSTVRPIMSIPNIPGTATRDWSLLPCRSGIILWDAMCAVLLCPKAGMALFACASTAWKRRLRYGATACSSVTVRTASHPRNSTSRQLCTGTAKTAWQCAYTAFPPQAGWRTRISGACPVFSAVWRCSRKRRPIWRTCGSSRSFQKILLRVRCVRS